MDNWLVEKSGNAVKGLAELVDLFHKYEHVLPEDFLLQAQSSLSYSLHFATMVFGSGSKSAYSQEDSKLILDNGSSAYKAISDRYRHGKTAYITRCEISQGTVDRITE